MMQVRSPKSKVQSPVRGWRSLILLFVLSALHFPLLGAVWSTDGTDSLLAQLDRVEFENVSVHRRGTATLAPAFDPVALPDEAAVWLTVADRSGNVYVATGNQGRLYRVSRAGGVEKVFDAGAGEILALTSDAAGAVYFGTTPEAKVYRIRARGKPELLCSTGETYVFSLLPTSDAGIFCATGEHGKLLHIDASGKTTAVFTARQAHLTALEWLVPGKKLLVGTSPDGVVYQLDLTSNPSEPEVSVLYDTPLNEVRAIVVDNSGRVYVGANAGEGSDSARAAVSSIDRAGVCRWSWPVPDSTVYALVLTGPPDAPRLLVATGNKGMVYELDTLGRFSIVYRLKETQALSLAARQDMVWLGTGNPGKLYRAGTAHADSGFIASASHDCANPARFGRLAFRASVPAGTALAFETRSGNSEKPDSTWSPWTTAAPSVSSPPRRYIQWRCRLYTSFPNLTPELRRVDVYYQPENLAPAIKKLDIAGPSVEDARKGAVKPLRAVTWEASDPDSDSLSFELYFREETREQWQRLGREITDCKYELDTRALADGWYELKLVASDQPSQPIDAALKTEQVSRPFLVDNTPPLVTGPGAGARDPKTDLCRISFSVQDALSPVAAARVSVNAGDWQTLEPDDHIFDSLSERFTTLVKLSPGENAVGVWVTDAQGNTAAARVIAR